MKEKGLIMEIDGKRMILLTKDGQFISRPISGLSSKIGDEAIIDVEKVRKPWFFVRILTVAALLMITFFSVPLWHHFMGTPLEGKIIAYMTVDINPSIELGFDLERKVIALHPLNQDGQKLLQNVSLIGLTSEQAVETIINAACQKGYLKPEKDNQVIINVTEKKRDEVKKEDFNHPIISQAEKTLSKNNTKAKVTVLNTDYELREKAEELGISTGKYALMVEAKDAGLNIDVNHVKKSGVVKAIEDAGGNPGEIIQRAQEEENYLKKIEKWDKTLRNTKKSIKDNQINESTIRQEEKQSNKHNFEKDKMNKNTVKSFMKQEKNSIIDNNNDNENIKNKKDDQSDKRKKNNKSISKNIQQKYNNNIQIEPSQQQQKDNREIILKEIKEKVKKNNLKSLNKKTTKKTENNHQKVKL